MVPLGAMVAVLHRFRKTFDVETFTVIAGMIWCSGFPIWSQPAIFGRASMQQPQVLIRCLVSTCSAEAFFPSTRNGFDQTWATQKSIGLNHGLSSFSTSTLQNLYIPHFCRLFEHRAKPMSFPYEWGDAVKTSYEMLWADVKSLWFWSFLIHSQLDIVWRK